jgi:molybdopterin-guanine dinucleotide biosynthesis protein A
MAGTIAATAGFVAAILTGGTGARLGGADKARLRYAGRTLLEYALDAVGDADELIVVGPPGGGGELRHVLEEPPLGGPVAGVYAARDALRSPVAALLVLAVDMPGVTASTVSRLADAAVGRDGAVLIA